jgi:hypothetical protein
MEVFFYVEERRPPLWSEFLATQRRCIVIPVRYELNLYMLLAVPGHALLWPFPVAD